MEKNDILITLKKHLSDLLGLNLLPEKTFLAGGTAVYFYLNHRLSVDLDFFTPTPYNTDMFIHKMKEFDDIVMLKNEK